MNYILMKDWIRFWSKVAMTDDCWVWTASTRARLTAHKVTNTTRRTRGSRVAVSASVVPVTVNDT